MFQWDTKQKWLPYLGLFAISVVMGGAVCLNAMSFDAMRVRAALDSGARLWHLLVTKNLALLCLVAPVGFLLSGLLAWRAGDLGAFFKACALMVCFIVLWLGVGNVLSVVVPIRDEPIWKRKGSGTLKQFLIAFTVAYLIGYLVNIMLVLRVFAAQELAARIGGWVIPAIIVVLSCVAMWVLLTVFAVALSQQPKIHRQLLKELADYTSNSEARALANTTPRRPCLRRPLMMASSEAPSRRRVALVLTRAMVVTVGVFLIFYFIPLRTTIDFGTLVRLLVGLALFAALIAWQLRAIARSPHPQLRAMETIAVAIPVFILLFAATYALMSGAQPAAFSEPMSRTDALYFTVTVFATVGFGDLSPVSTGARVVVTIQMIADLLLIGLVLRSILDAVERGKARQTISGQPAP